jgi:spore coat polysaccharide biosynthesis protein SpsF
MAAGRVVAVLQARMGSTRFPGKVLAPIAGRPMLEHILKRALRARLISQVVVATTKLPPDDQIVSVASNLNVQIYRGSEHDVLDRYYQAAKKFGAQTVVRLTADNPLIEGDFIDWCIGQFLEAAPSLDYLDTGTSRSFPYGLSVEVFSFAALTAAWQEASDQAQREHVTLFIREHPERFHLTHLGGEEENSDLRWTVDTVEDMMAVRRLYDELGLADRPVTYREVLSHVRRKRD